jgi:hypothetical protein
MNESINHATYGIFDGTVGVVHRVIVYTLIETKATSRLPYFGHLTLNTYLSVFRTAALATELGSVQIYFISADLFLVKNVSCCPYLLIVAMSALKTVR